MQPRCMFFHHINQGKQYICSNSCFSLLPRLQPVEHRIECIQLNIKSLHLHSCIAWILPSNKRNKLSRDIDSKFVLVYLVTTWAIHPRLSEFIHIIITTIPCLTFGCCITSKAGKVNKSSICAPTRTIASQWLTSFVSIPIKAQVARRVVESHD